MTDLSAQRRLAADVLDVGKNRVWFDPDRQGDVAEAITREDVRELVDDGVIRAHEVSGNSRGRAREREEKRSYGHGTGHGTRNGSKGARQDPSDDHRQRVRAQRKRVRQLRDADEISASEYRDLYGMISGGEFRSVARLENYVEQNYGDQ